MTQSAARAGRRQTTHRPPLLLIIVAAAATIAVVAVVTAVVSLALFTAQGDAAAVFGTKAVFPAERVTPAFRVGDSSAGSLVDRSSPFAVADDDRTTTTKAWSATFATNRYVEFDLNAPLPSGLESSALAFNIRIASSGSGEACYYFDVSNISNSAVRETLGDPLNPVGCTTGPALASFSIGLTSVGTTTLANDLRIRVFARESAGDPIVIDVATVSGATPYAPFTLYPVVFRDAADMAVTSIPWELDSP